MILSSVWAEQQVCRENMMRHVANSAQQPADIQRCEYVYHVALELNGSSQMHIWKSLFDTPPAYILVSCVRQAGEMRSAPRREFRCLWCAKWQQEAISEILGATASSSWSPITTGNICSSTLQDTFHLHRYYHLSPEQRIPSLYTFHCPRRPPEIIRQNGSYAFTEPAVRNRCRPGDGARCYFGHWAAMGREARSWQGWAELTSTPPHQQPSPPHS